MMDGDQKPRGEPVTAVDGGYWKKSVSAVDNKKVGTSWGRMAHKSLKVVPGANQLSQKPANNGGYSSRRAEGRAVMRASGPAVEPNFSDKNVPVAKAKAPFAQFAGQVAPSIAPLPSRALAVVLPGTGGCMWGGGV